MRARTMAGTLVVLLLSLPLWAMESGKVTGRVVDTLGDPIPGARIEVQGPEGRRSTTTNGEGEFQVDTLPSGRWTLRSHLTGFAAETRAFVLGKGEHERCMSGLGVAQLGGDLHPCELEGSVKDERGRALGASTVTVISAFNHELEGLVQTDAAGRFEVDVWSSGLHVVYAYRPGFAIGATAFACYSLQPRAEVSLTLPKLDGSSDR